MKISTDRLQWNFTALFFSSVCSHLAGKWDEVGFPIVFSEVSR